MGVCRLSFPLLALLLSRGRTVARPEMQLRGITHPPTVGGIRFSRPTHIYAVERPCTDRAAANLEEVDNAGAWRAIGERQAGYGPALAANNQVTA